MQRSSSSEKSKKESLNDVLQKEMFLMNLTLTHGKMNRGRELASVLIIGLGALDDGVAPAYNLLDRVMF